MRGGGKLSVAAGLGFAALLALSAVWLDDYQALILGEVGIVVIIGVGLNVLIGLSGQISIGQVAFQAIGAGGAPFVAAPAPGAAPAGGGRPSPAIGAADFQAFEQALYAIQAAWSAHDLAALRRLATPEMVSYFAEQLAEQTSRGVRNVVRDVRLDRGDLAEAWSENGRDYATVAMQFSMIDVTLDASGRVVDGSPGERVSATELWTFLRAPGGAWILSAIQQAR